MAADKEVLKIAVEEQRRFHDELTASYRGMRVKIVSFIGAILALLAFLYATPDAASTSTLTRLFIPETLYGKIFYGLGLGLLLLALAKLIHGARPNGKWSFPLGHDGLASLDEPDETKFLARLKDEYIETTAMNLKEHSKKNEALRDSFYPMLIGAIVLIVLRYFQ